MAESTLGIVTLLSRPCLIDDLPFMLADIYRLDEVYLGDELQALIPEYLLGLGGSSGLSTIQGPEEDSHDLEGKGFGELVLPIHLLPPQSPVSQ